MSVEELRNMLKELDGKMDKEVEVIKAKYAKEKKELDVVIQKKKQK